MILRIFTKFSVSYLKYIYMYYIKKLLKLQNHKKIMFFYFSLQFDYWADSFKDVIILLIYSFKVYKKKTKKLSIYKWNIFVYYI